MSTTRDLALATIAAISLAGVIAGGSCDSNIPGPAGSAPDVGSVSVQLTLPDGNTVSSVHYVLHNGATPNSSGDIAVDTPGATPTIALATLAGTGFTVDLSATRSDGLMCLGTSSSFDVVANKTVMVKVVMKCQTMNGLSGNISVEGVTDNCPTVVAASVSSLVVASGGAVDVAVTGNDVDVQDVLSYAWKATAGAFDNATARATKYHCPATAGLQTLTAAVSDGVPDGGAGSDPDAGLPYCTTTSMVVVNCGLCGNGSVDSQSGEQCDPPDGKTCDSTCQTIPVVCGNFIVQMGEACDPPNGTTCSTTCQNIPIVCGNGIVQTGEQCDPPDGKTCSTTCRNLPSGAGGAGGAAGAGGAGGAGNGGNAGAGGNGS